MAKVYHFSDEAPVMGSIIQAFKELEDLKEFTRINGGSKGTEKIWEIEGDIDSDYGTNDSIQIRVFDAKEFY